MKFASASRPWINEYLIFIPEFHHHAAVKNSYFMPLQVLQAVSGHLGTHLSSPRIVPTKLLGKRLP